MRPRPVAQCRVFSILQVREDPSRWLLFEQLQLPRFGSSKCRPQMIDALRVAQRSTIYGRHAAGDEHGAVRWREASTTLSVIFKVGSICSFDHTRRRLYGTGDVLRADEGALTSADCTALSTTISMRADSGGSLRGESMSTTRTACMNTHSRGTPSRSIMPWLPASTYLAHQSCVSKCCVVSGPFGQGCSRRPGPCSAPTNSTRG